MRFVDVVVGTDPGVSLELHPRLNVVVAGAAEQERIAALLGRAFVLAGTEVTGTIDGGSYLTPFDPTAVVALDLVGEGVPLLGPGELPPPDRRARDAEMARARAEIVDGEREVQRISGELDDLAKVLAATTAAIDAGNEELDACTDRRHDVEASIATIDARPVALAAERQAATDAAAAATGRLEQLRLVRSELGAALGPAEDAASVRIGDDTEVLKHLVERAGTLGGLRADQQAEALRWLADVTAGRAPISAAAQSLIAEVSQIEGEWQLLSRRGIEGDPDVALLAHEQNDMESNVSLLDGLSASGVLGDTAKSQIDAAHIALLQAAKPQQEALAVAEHEVLSRYGFDSYLEYTIATSTRSVGQAVEAKRQELRERLTEVETRLVAARSSAAGQIEEMAARREPARERMVRLVGHEPEGPPLDAVARVPEVPHAVTRLTVSLDEAVEAAQDEVVRYRQAVAELDEEEQALTDRSLELSTQMEQLTARSNDLDTVLARAGDELVSLTDRRGVLDAAAQQATQDLHRITEHLGVLASVPADRYGPDDVGPVVEALAARIDALVGSSGSVVLCDTLAPMPSQQAGEVLRSLAARSVDVQLLYLTGGASWRDWGRSIDPSLGRLIVVSSRWSPRRLGRKVLRRTR